MRDLAWLLFLFFFNDTATTEIYTLSLHDALPISASARVDADASHRGHERGRAADPRGGAGPSLPPPRRGRDGAPPRPRSEEHTSELQSRLHLVCRLLLEKKKNVHYTETC